MTETKKVCNINIEETQDSIDTYLEVLKNLLDSNQNSINDNNNAINRISQKILNMKLQDEFLRKDLTASQLEIVDTAITIATSSK